MNSKPYYPTWYSRQLSSALAMLCAVALSVLLKPKVLDSNNAFLLDDVIPRSFGSWIDSKSPYLQVDVENLAKDETTINQPYDQKLMRTYENDRGDKVMLALAWGKNQRQEVKIHRPELCYTAQGFEIASQADVTLPEMIGSLGPIPVKRLLAKSARGSEAVVYWIRIGSLYSQNAWETRLHILEEGLKGRISDGILVRASSPIERNEETADKYRMIEEFLTELVSSIAPSSRYLLVR